MNDHIEKTIQDFRKKLETAEQEVIRLKRTINDLCDMGGKARLFRDDELEASSGKTPLTFANDAFYGKPLASCVKEILSARKTANLGAAGIDELYDALLGHGYHFEGKEENRKNILRTALRKNSDFHKLPHGGYGLREWYGRLKPSPNGDDEEGENETHEQAAPEKPKGKKAAADGESKGAKGSQ
jgi:hypothetical protein